MCRSWKLRYCVWVIGVVDHGSITCIYTLMFLLALLHKTLNLNAHGCVCICMVTSQLNACILNAAHPLLSALSCRSRVPEETHRSECAWPPAEPGRYHVQLTGVAAQPQVQKVTLLVLLSFNRRWILPHVTIKMWTYSATCVLFVYYLCRFVCLLLCFVFVVCFALPRFLFGFVCCFVVALLLVCFSFVLFCLFCYFIISVCVCVC